MKTESLIYFFIIFACVGVKTDLNVKCKVSVILFLVFNPNTVSKLYI